ncbi:MAG TPA: hypothetical protein VIY48_18450 [Candidatus Paceibacterota bacterium]
MDHDYLLGAAFLKGQEDKIQGLWRPETVIHCSECRSQYVSGWTNQHNSDRREVHIGGMIWRIP